MQEDWAWLAGIIDGEGCVSFQRRNKTSPTPTVYVCNTSTAMMMKVAMLLHLIGAEYYYNHRKLNHPTHKAIHAIRVTNLDSVIALLEKIQPFLVSKKTQSKLVLESIYLSKRSKRKDACRVRAPFANRVWELNKKCRPSNATLFKLED